MALIHECKAGDVLTVNGAEIEIKARVKIAFINSVNLVVTRKGQVVFTTDGAKGG